MGTYVEIQNDFQNMFNLYDSFTVNELRDYIDVRYDGIYPEKNG